MQVVLYCIVLYCILLVHFAVTLSKMFCIFTEQEPEPNSGARIAETARYFQYNYSTYDQHIGKSFPSLFL